MERQKKWSFRNLIVLEALEVVRGVKPITIDLMKKAAATMGLNASLPFTDRLLRPCEQARARLSPAGVDRVSLPVPGTEDRR